MGIVNRFCYCELLDCVQYGVSTFVVTNYLSSTLIYLNNGKAEKDMLRVGRNRIRLQLTPQLPDGIEIYISEEKSIDFQRWLD